MVLDEDQPRGRDVATLKSERKWLSPWVWGRTEKENMVAGPENWLWESHGGERKNSGALSFSTPASRNLS